MICCCSGSLLHIHRTLSFQHLLSLFEYLQLLFRTQNYLFIYPNSIIIYIIWYVRCVIASINDFFSSVVVIVQWINKALHTHNWRFECANTSIFRFCFHLWLIYCFKFASSSTLFHITLLIVVWLRLIFQKRWEIYTIHESNCFVINGTVPLLMLAYRCSGSQVTELIGAKSRYDWF